jgi:hypothetical protein
VSTVNRQLPKSTRESCRRRDLQIDSKITE